MHDVQGSAPAGALRRGRHLDLSRDPEILRAALELLAELGYDRLTMEAVAGRVHAGKATLYRRWPSKAELVVDAVSRWDEDLRRLQPDSGSLRDDLAYAFLGAVRLLDDLQVGLAATLVSAARRDPKLAAVFEERFVRPRLVRLQELFSRARERGEVADGHDLELLAAVGPALIFHRLLLGCQPLTREYVDRVIDEVIMPLVATPIGSGGSPARRTTSPIDETAAGSAAGKAST